MNYGCQFTQLGPPEGFHDEDFEYLFNSVTTPAFSATLAAGASLRDIPLVLETDADFALRGLRILNVSTPAVSFQIREPGGKLLMPEHKSVPLLQSFQSGGLAILPAGAISLMTVPVEPEILCSEGGVFLVHIVNPGAAPVALSVQVMFFGVKRRSNACQ